MSKLNEIFNVEDEQKFIYDGMTFRISNGQIFHRNSNGNWEEVVNGYLICKMIEHIDGIRIMPKKLKLTERQIIAIKGRIAEGWNWIVKSKCFNDVYCLMITERPIKDDDFYPLPSNRSSFANPDLFDFVTYENSPIYLPDLLGDDNNE